MSTDTEKTEEVEPWTVGGWCGERYAKHLGVQIAEEIIEEDRETHLDYNDETRQWWTDFYGRLRALDRRDIDEVGAFLKRFYEDRVGDLDEKELAECAEQFSERMDRAA